MDRQIVYVDSSPLDTDQLNQSKNTMIALGMAIQAILGTSTVFDGLTCSPTGPASLQVLVSPGSVYALENVDNTAYGSIEADTTHQIMKQGILLDTKTLSCPAPGTTGQSINYLIQAAYQDTDTGATVLPYFNPDNPDVAFNGPNNTGVSQNTVREGQCIVSVKAGVAATTGSQTTPAADAGFTGLWVVTVANGQTTIVSGNIAQVTGAPIIGDKLLQKISQSTADLRYGQITSIQNSSYIFANDTSGTANTITATLSPAPSAYAKGQTFVINIANTNNGASVANFNGLGNKSITLGGSALTGGELKANTNTILSYDGTNFEIISSAASATAIPSRTAAFTSSGSWTAPAGVTSILVDAAAGGGGGGGTNGTSNGGEGGGGGDAVKGMLLTVVPGTTYAITIGAKGSGGTSSSNGASGGTTSIGALLSLSPGTGGNSSGVGAGMPGGAGGVHGNDCDLLMGGSGGGSIFGSGGAARAGDGLRAGGYGTGGGGGSVSSGARNGGDGSPGFVIIQW